MQSKLPCCAQLCCVLLLPVLRSDRQYGGNLRGAKKQGAVKDQMHVEEKKGKVVLRTQHALYPVLLYVQKKAHSAATQHRSEGHGTAPHGPARRYAALLGHI